MYQFTLSPDEIPEELRLCPRWVNWRSERRRRKPTKVPRMPNGAPASHSDPSTWSSFERTLEAYESGGFAGVGFVFSGDDSICGVDFDHVRNPETGVIEPWALAWLRKLDSYTEVSPSGEGVKAWLRAELPAGRRRKPGLEVYDRRRFFTATGAFLSQFSTAIELRQAEVEELLAAEFPSIAKTRGRSSSKRYTGPRLDLDEILETGKVTVFGEIADSTAARVYSICCPWWREHSGGDVSGTRVGQYSDGALFFVCEHSHCAHRAWRDFRRAVSPQEARLTVSITRNTGHPVHPPEVNIKHA